MGDLEQWDSGNDNPFGYEDPRKRQQPIPLPTQPAWQDTPLPQQQAMPQAAPQQPQPMPPQAQQPAPQQDWQASTGPSPMTGANPFEPAQQQSPQQEGSWQPSTGPSAMPEESKATPPTKAHANDPFGPSYTPNYKDVPKANIWAQIAGAARPGSLLSLAGSLFGNQREIQQAMAMNQTELQRQQAAEQQRFHQQQAGYFGHQFGARPTPYQDPTTGQWMIQGVNGPTQIGKPQNVVTQEMKDETQTGIADNKQQKPQDAQAILLDPAATPAQKKAATEYIRMTHPQMGVLDQKTQDVDAIATSLVKAAKGDPSAISELKDFGGFGSQRTQIAAAALRKDTNFSTKELERIAATVRNFTTSSQMTAANKQITATGTFLEHAADAFNQAKDLERTGSPLLNMPIVALQRAALGDPKVAQFEASLMAPIAEFLRIINSGNVAYQPERTEMQTMLAKYNSPKQFLTAIPQMAKIVSERWNNLNAEFKRGTKTHSNKNPADFLSVFPEAFSSTTREAAKTLGITFTGDSGAPSSVPSGQEPGQPMHDKSKSGKPITSADGGKTWSYD